MTTPNLKKFNNDQWKILLHNREQILENLRKALLLTAHNERLHGVLATEIKFSERVPPLPVSPTKNETKFSEYQLVEALLEGFTESMNKVVWLAIPKDFKKINQVIPNSKEFYNNTSAFGVPNSEVLIYYPFKTWHTWKEYVDQHTLSI